MLIGFLVLFSAFSFAFLDFGDDIFLIDQSTTGGGTGGSCDNNASCTILYSTIADINGNIQHHAENNDYNIVAAGWNFNSILKIAGGFANNGITFENGTGFFQNVIIANDLNVVNISDFNAQGDIIPGFDNLFKLGSTSFRWSELNAFDGNFSRDLIVDRNTFLGTTRITATENIPTLVIQEMAGQTADVFQILNSNGDLLLDVLGTGELDLNATATEAETVALDIRVHANGFPDAVGLQISYVTGVIEANQEEQAIIVVIDDTEAAVGSDVVGIEIVPTEGASRIIGLKVGVLVNPVEQLSGVFENMTRAEVAGVDRLAEFISTGSNVEVFSLDDDNVLIGFSTKFEEIEWLLTTGASQGGVAPTFEYSISSDFNSFFPSDTTRGLRENGVMIWDDELIPAWSAAPDGNFLIRITRTRNNINTPPVESKVQIAAATEFIWDLNGNVFVSTVTATDGNFTQDVNIGRNSTAQGIITANVFSGSGISLTSIPAASILPGTFGGSTTYTVPENLIIIGDGNISGGDLTITKAVGGIGGNTILQNTGSASTSNRKTAVSFQATEATSGDQVDFAQVLGQTNVSVAENSYEGLLTLRVAANGVLVDGLNVQGQSDGTVRVGIGTDSPSTTLHSVRDADASGLFERTSSSSTNVSRIPLRVLFTTDQDMVDGFGVGIEYQIQDSVGTKNNIGNIGAVRAGADNTGDLVFKPRTAGTENERMRIEAGGNVGIGTTTPQQPLNVIGDANITLDINVGRNLTAEGIITANVFSGSGASLTSIPDGALVETYALLAGRSGGQELIGGTSIGEELTLTSNSGIGANSITFGNDSFNLNSNGAANMELRFFEDVSQGTNYVGFVGPTTIATSFAWELPPADGNPNQVLGTDGSNVLIWRDLGDINGSTFPGSITVNNSKGNNDFVVHGDFLDNLFFVDADTNGVCINCNNPISEFDVFGNYSQRVKTNAALAVNIRDSGNTNRFRVDLDGADASILLRERGNTYTVVIDSNGISTLNGGGVRMAELETAGAETANVCMVSSNGELLEETDDVCTVSARRFKKNIEELGYGLQEVLALTPRFFEYKEEYKPGQGRKIGFIAEEVALVIPEVVSYNPDGQTDSVDYKVLTAVIANAIKEQQEQIDKMEKKIFTLEAS